MNVHFDKHYKVEVDPNNDVKILKKDGSPITNEKGTAELTAAEVVSKFASQYVIQATGDPGNGAGNGTAGNVKTKTGNPGQQPGLSKAERDLAEMEFFLLIFFIAAWTAFWWCMSHIS